MPKPFKKSFYDWCIENNQEDWLQLWDYELNDCSPKDIGYGINKKYYFKCPRGTHKSELKRLNNISNGGILLKCKKCNSFGQYLIDEYGEDALELYWDYDNNTVNPFEIAKCYNGKVWIKCQKTDYHGSYETRCNDFVSKKTGCSYCGNHKTHPKDSFAQYHIDNTDRNFIEKYWSKRNILNPFELTPHSAKKCWFICQNNEEHEDYEATCANFTKGRRCPICKESKGERKIREYLNIYKISFIAQKTFPNLLGIGNGSLSYDFYIPKQNLLIEYQGEQHEDEIFGFESKKKLEVQQEHDRRKREYAEQNNIRLLEIWYYDFDNIEEILSKILNNS